MEDNEVESRKARIQLIIDEEALMSQSELDNEKLFPQSIEVLQAHRRPEPPWAGLGGKMASEVKNVDNKVWICGVFCLACAAVGAPCSWLCTHPAILTRMYV